MEKDGDYASAHVDGEPAGGYVSWLNVGNGEGLSNRESGRCNCSRWSVGEGQTAGGEFEG